MSIYEAKPKFREAQVGLALWRRGSQIGFTGIGKWILGVVVLVLVLMSASVVMASTLGVEQTTDALTALSPLPMPTPVPTITPTSVPIPSSGFHYTVRPGDTLFSIARRFDTTVEAIIQANGIVNPAQIFYGQVFWIPSTSGSSGDSDVYIVQPGDTLYSIARRFGMTYQTLAALNDLRHPYTIYIGQRLIISDAGASRPPAGHIHIVRRGDTLYAIALRYGVTPWAIAEANDLWNLNFIYVGQHLVIP